MCDVRTRRCRRAAIGRTEQGAVAPIHDDASTAAVEAPAVDRDGSVCPGIEGHGGHDELGRKSPSLVPGPAAVKGSLQVGVDMPLQQTESATAAAAAAATAAAAAEAASVRASCARFRWHLAYTLLHNRSLAADRKQQRNVEGRV